MASNSQFSGMQQNRPPLIGSVAPPQSSLPSMSMQYRPVGPPQQHQPYISMPAQQFQPIGPTNIGIPPPPPQIQFPQQMSQLPARPGAGGDIMPQSQAIPVPDFHQSRPITPVPAQPPQNLQISNNFIPGYAGPRIPLSSSYNLSAGQQQTNSDSATLYQPISQTTIPSFPVDGQPWLSTGNQSMKPITPVQQNGEQYGQAVNADVISKPDSGEKVSSIWIEHSARHNGKKYYYNRVTGLSSWEKPLELMTPNERADASTDWREYTCPQGRKYYYNKVTKQSKWRMPDELKLAREGLKLDSFIGLQAGQDVDSHAPASVPHSRVNTSSSSIEVSSFPTQTVVSSPIPVAPVVTDQPKNFISSISPTEVSPVAKDALEAVETAEPVVAVLERDVNLVISTTTTTENSSDTLSAQEAVTPTVGVSPGQTEETKIGVQDSGKSEEKNAEQGPTFYENKLEARNAFKTLLEAANVGSDWTWDQAMRAITNDRRYGALKTLGERKQVFNEFISQKRKQEAEDRRSRMRKAREDFRNMLEESKELTSSSRWSKMISIFENDERYKAVERPKDREDLFEDHIKELERKERAKALEDHKRNKMEYLEFLKSCEFIKASSQWRKVQDRLEADERCSRLEKIDRLEIFQEYIRDLEKEEEEERKLRMEEQRKTERKNRDEFRKLMEEHIMAGIITAKTHWRDYCSKVKDVPAYIAVSSNTSGATAKDLFEDVVEELEKQFIEDRAQIKDVIKLREVNLTSTWTLEDFKTAIGKNSLSPVSDVNLKLVFDELLERVREKEEKEAKRRKRLGEDIYEFLLASKEITSSSRWEECKRLVEDRFAGEESFLQEIFDKFMLDQKDRAKERDHKRRDDKTRKDKERKHREKKKDKQRREKEKGDESRKRKDRTSKSDESESDRSESHGGFEEEKRSGKRSRKRFSTTTSLDDVDKDRSRDDHRKRN